MPLKSGQGKKVRQENIAEILDSYKNKGSIGTSKPASKKAAIRQAVAISYAKQREGKRGRK